MIVLDASAAVHLILHTDRSPPVAERLGDPDTTLHAPHLIDAEVAQVLRRYVLTGQVDGQRAHGALADFLALRITRYPHAPLLERAWELIDNVTVYDGLYLVLAEVLHAPLVTYDAALAGVPGSSASVEVLA